MTKAKGERKLTKAEALRKKNFEVQSARLESQGYIKTEHTISARKINLLAFPPGLLLIAVFAWGYSAVGGTFFPTSIVFSFRTIGIFLLALAVVVVLHEGLHGLTFALFCKDKTKSIQFGFIPQCLAPYCTCLEPLRFGANLLSGLMPFLVLGVGVWAVALVWKSMFLFYLACLNALSAGGDMVVVMLLLRHRKGRILDHPTECGFVVFEK